MNMHPLKELKGKRTQKELAKLLGISETNLSYKMNTYSIGTIDHAIELGKALGMKRFYFYLNDVKVTVSV
jgi:transcriptional regulator with XRE-family HTH domain